MKYKMKHYPFNIVKMCEEEVANYTKAPYAVAIDSFSNTIFLCCKYLKVQKVTIPQKTYLSIPQSIINAGGKIYLEATNWQGIYNLKPYPIYDSSLRFTSNIYIPKSFICLSFHYKKHLPIGKGGMILSHNLEAVNGLKKARYEGRSELNYKDDIIEEMGWNMYMTPNEAAQGLALMQNLNLINPDLKEENGYRNLDYFLSFLN